MDFSKMKWRIDEVPLDKEVTGVYPELGENMKEHRMKITQLDISFNIFIRYCVLCYHQFSPYVQAFDDILVRKRKVLLALNMDQEHALLSKPMKAEVAYAILQFLKFESNSKYKKKVFYEELLAKNQAELMDNTLKKTDLEAVERLEILIEKLSGETYKGDDELFDHAEAFEVMEKRKIFPEEQ